MQHVEISISYSKINTNGTHTASALGDGVIEYNVHKSQFIKKIVTLFGFAMRYAFKKVITCLFIGLVILEIVSGILES